MVKWKVNFNICENRVKNRMKRILPLELMKLSDTDLNKQFVIVPGSEVYTSRELVFKFYEENCRILNINGTNSISSIINLLTELPPIYVFHSELSLINEKFTDLSDLNIINAVYGIYIREYEYTGNSKLFVHNLNKLLEEGLQFYWRN